MSFSLIAAVSIYIASQTVQQGYEQLPPSYICIEAETGKIITESNADLQRPPASMLKMMVMLLADEGVHAGKWSYDTPITTSKAAQSMGGTQIYLAAGDIFPLEDMLMAMAVLSANDASVAVAESLWGSVPACLDAMNRRAAELGMKNTHFTSVHGLPPADRENFDLTSARDMAILAKESLKYPQTLVRSSTREFALRPNTPPRPSTNKLMDRMPDCDGLKTGYIRASGFCLTATAKRNDIRLIAVLMGSDREGRFNHTRDILNECFAKITRVQPVFAGMSIGKAIPVQKSMEEEVGLRAASDITALINKDESDRLFLEITAPVSLEAPVLEGTEC
ncbi:MAG TPA: D-alanyl-D-alanine carboxypeptidase family protein, partial [Candidatus Hydrogenedentes bacterium]|nr:D-alanyl-D-alanine carboxypeptidase family protein [Candidatus Hydrogenedentota bacterium]